MEAQLPRGNGATVEWRCTSKTGMDKRRATRRSTRMAPRTTSSTVFGSEARRSRPPKRAGWIVHPSAVWTASRGRATPSSARIRRALWHGFWCWPQGQARGSAVLVPTVKRADTETVEETPPAALSADRATSVLRREISPVGPGFALESARDSFFSDPAGAPSGPRSRGCYHGRQAWRAFVPITALAPLDLVALAGRSRGLHT
jgi:hypothetical protein